MSFEKGVFATIGHFEQKLLKTFFGFLGEQGCSEHPSVRFFYRSPFLSGLLFESLDYGVFKVSDK
jgi:hypothetical protein